MSLKYEQHRALKLSRDFMRDLLDPAKTRRVPKEIRQRAASCLRHYPFLNDGGEPVFSGDCFLSQNAKGDSQSPDQSL